MTMFLSNPLYAVLLGIVLIGLGIWILPKPFRVDFAFYRRYEPRSLLGLFLIVLGMVAFLFALRL